MLGYMHSELRGTSIGATGPSNVEGQAVRCVIARTPEQWGDDTAREL